MTEDKLDAILKQVLQDALEKDFPLSQETSASAPKMLHSKAFTKSMESLRKNPFGWYEKRTRPPWKTFTRRAAVVLLCLTAGLGSLFVVSPEVRAAVRRWVVEWDNTSVFYRYAGEPLEGEMPSYEINPLPEGYVQVERVNDHESVYITYENEKGKQLSLEYHFMQQGIGFDIIIENLIVSDVLVNQSMGQFFLSQDHERTNALTWVNEQQNIQFFIDGFFDEKEMIRMAESLEISN